MPYDFDELITEEKLGAIYHEVCQEDEHAEYRTAISAFRRGDMHMIRRASSLFPYVENMIRRKCPVSDIIRTLERAARDAKRPSLPRAKAQR